MSSPFTILNENLNNGIEVQNLEGSTPVEQIRNLLSKHALIIFMKGNADFPQCGFSANAVRILNTLNKPYATLNILNFPEIRQALKEYSNWPTYPQVYFNQELLGGNDVLTEMYASGELNAKIKD